MTSRCLCKLLIKGKKILTIESPFALVGFAKVESQFVLSAPGVSQTVQVCLPFQKLVDAFRVAVVRSIV